MKRIAFGCLASFLVSTVLQAQVLTNTLIQLGSHEVGFQIESAAFDARSGAVFVTRPGHSNIFQLSLADGTVRTGWSFASRVGPLALSPDHRRLYAGMPSDVFGAQTGRVAVIDVELGAMVREVGIDLRPEALIATDTGIIMAAGTPSSGQADIGSFDFVTGARISATLGVGPVGLALGPGQNAFFVGEYDYVRKLAVDPLTGEFEFAGMSPQLSYPVPVEYGLYAHPNGVHLLSRSGRLLDNLNPSAVLQTSYRFEAVAFDMTRHAFFVAALSRTNPAEAFLMQYHSETLELGSLSPIDPSTRFLELHGSELVLIATRTNGATLIRFAHPAAGGERNLDPQADFRWFPDSAGTYSAVTFDAGLSADEDSASLSFRWDWNNDGRYDTDWMRSTATEHTFNLTGPRTVGLQVKDRFGAVHRVEKTLIIGQVADYGAPAETNLAFQLPFAAADVAFDPLEPIAYFADTNRNRLVRMNLETGLAERDYWMQYSPQLLAITPGGNSLYASLVVRPRPVNTSTSFVAHIDLREKARMLDCGIDLEPQQLLPTDLGILIVSAGRYLRTYDSATGQRKWSSGSTATLPAPVLVMHPSQTNLYSIWTFFSEQTHVALHTNTGALNDLWTSAPPFDWGGKAYAHPNGSNLLTRNGYVYSASHVKSNDMVRLGQYFTGKVEKVAFDLPRQSIFAIASPASGKTNLYHFHSDSLALVSTHSISNGTRALMAYDQGVFTVAVRSNTTFVYRIPHPAAGGDTNTAPVARFVSNPSAPTTLDPMVLDASGSTDDQGAGLLLYRWDWDGDGVFDTAFASLPTVIHRFNLSGPKTVVLEVKDAFGASGRATNTFAVALVEDPGYPSATNTPFELPFEVTDMAFEKQRPVAYATDMAGRRLARLNLVTGVIERWFDFDYYPAMLSLSADETRLYVATLAISNRTVYPKLKLGYVACFDLTRGVKLREFKIAVDPYSITAIGSNILAVCIGYGGLGGSGGFGTYDVDTGGPLHSSSPYVYGGVAADPSQRAVLFNSYGTSANLIGLLTVDPVSGTLTNGVWVGDAGSYYASGKAFPIPGKPLLVARGAGVFRYSLSPTNRIEWLRNLLPQSVESLSPDPLRPAFFTVGDGSGGSALVYYNADSLEAAAVYPDTNRLRFVHATAETVYCVAVEAGSSRVLHRLNPAAGSETNQPPVAAFEWSPGPWTAGTVLTVDASGSTDDRDTGALRYRWDFSNDGLFEMQFSNSPTAALMLTNAGPFIVTLEVMDRFGATARVRKTLEVLPGADAETTFALQFAAKGAAFDPRRPILCLSDATNRRLVWLNLQTAQIEHEIGFEHIPGPLALHPVDDVLYAGLAGDSGTGAVAVIDLATRSVTKQFGLASAPFCLAVSKSGFLVAVPADGQWVPTRAYRLTTGEETGSTFLRHRSHAVVHPDGTAVYLADTDVNPPGLVKCALDPETGALAYPVGGPTPGQQVFMHPDGKFLLLGNAQAVTTRGGTQPDMEVLHRLADAYFKAATFDLDRQALFASGNPAGEWYTGRLYWLDSHSYETHDTYDCDVDMRYLHAAPQYLYGVAPKSDHTLIYRRANPASLLRFEGITRAESGQLEITLRGPPGNQIVISSSTNLVNWQPISTNSPDRTIWIFRAKIGDGARFYRAEPNGP